MADQSELLIFLNEIECDITADVQPNAGNPADFREFAFTRMLADELDASGILESPVACHYENGKQSTALKVSGYSVPDEDSRLDLILSLYDAGPHQSVPTLNGSDIDIAFNKMERFFGKALKGLHEEIDPALPERHMAERIYQMREDIDRVNFHLLTNSRLAVRREKQRKTEVHGVPATYDVWDIERFRRLRESGASYEALNVDLRPQYNGGLPCVRLDVKEEGYQTCIAIFPGSLLHDLYDEHGSRLLELNVRSYLQAKGKINKGILETLRNDPQDFMAYNNGITVVAEKIVFGHLKDGRSGILELQGMQIVNGGQTTASIHRAAKEFEADLSNVYVQGKIVTVDPTRFNEVVPFISRYANSQNKVTDTDLQANHRFHVGLERVAKREWAPDQASKWFYERARGSYQTARSREATTESLRRKFDREFPTHQRFTKEDLAKFENCWRGLPYIVNRGGQKNFTQFMTFIKADLGESTDRWEPSPEEFKRYIGKAILFRDVQRIVKEDESITAYRINVTAYIVALLAERTARRIDLDAIWKRQAISPALADTARLWAPVVFKALLDYSQKQTVHIDNILKSQAAWEHILSLDLHVTRAAERELRPSPSSMVGTVREGLGSVRGDELSAHDHNNVARCLEIDAAKWLVAVNWAKQSGDFSNLTINVAATLAGYAAQGWTRMPSQKQAKHGAVIIEAARSAGVISH
ncbi:MAG: AIPR family protein [Verrucomicrobiaceae bacterium]